MGLNHSQKTYIKRNIRNKNILKIASDLNIPVDEISYYLEKKWGRAKLNRFLLTSVSENPDDFKFKNRIILLFLTVLIFITFANSLDNAFVSDDIAEIAQKETLGDLGFIIRTYYLGIIRHLIYWFTFHIAGLTPLAFRLTNILFHLGSTFLIFYILSSIFKSKRIAFFASSIFAIHPAILEAYVWISGGIYAQYTFFFLLSFFLYITRSENKKRYIFSIIAFASSLISHPVMPVALWVIFPFYEFCFGNIKRNWPKAIPYFLLACSYVVINLLYIPQRESTLQQVHYQQRGMDNPLIQLPVAISSYFELIFFPKTLTLYHSELAFGRFSFAIRSILTLVFFGLILYTFKKSRAVFFWLSLFIISLSPTLTPFRLNWIVAERYIYLPSIGIFAILGIILNRITSYKKYAKVIWALFFLILLGLSTRSILRNIDWHSEDNLWIATGKTSPSSPNTHNNLGDVYGRQGDKQRSLQEFQTAIALKPDYADAYHNSGNVYRELGQLDKALEYYQKAADISPILWQSHQNMAAIYFQTGQFDLAEQSILKAISINPKNLNLYNNLGIIYLANGDREKAKEIFNKVLSADPQNQIAKQGLIEANK